MKTYVSATINIGDDPEDQPRLQSFQGHSVMSLSSDFQIWFREKTRVANLTALRDAITAHLAEIESEPKS